jgi:flavin reductase (DIM6/NTAB) family NADH-FMN oxidoreductase RutF
MSDTHAAPTPDQLRQAMALAPSAVTIVTTTGPNGPAGATVNAVTSLSLDPPLMLACLDRGSRTLEILRATGAFGVNVLGAGDEGLARAFASKAPHTQKFREVAYSEREGVPILERAVTWVACRVRELHHGGDHEIAVGAIAAVGGAGGDPLVFVRGAYRSLD